MTSTAQQSRFSRGGENAESADEALRAARGGSGGGFRKTNYLPKIGKGKSIFLRYLTDSPDWVYIDSHSFVPTKGAPEWWPKDKTFPETMPAICRYDKAFREVVGDDEMLAKGAITAAQVGQVIFPAVYTDCYIDDAKLKNKWDRLCNPAVRVYALAILREEVTGTKEMVAAGQIPAEMEGKRVGLKDSTREVEVVKRDDKGEVVKDGDNVVTETITEPAIIVINQAVGNYFSGLQSMFGMYGSTVDRDYAVKQQDEGKDVEFVHIPLDPIPSLKPGQPAWERYEKAIADQGESVDIEAILMDRSGDDFFGLFFDPSKEAKQRGGDAAKTESKGGSSTGQPSAPASQQEAAPSNDVGDADRLAQMRDRVRGLSEAATSPTPAPQEAPKETEVTKEPEATPAASAPTMVDFSAP